MDTDSVGGSRYRYRVRFRSFEFGDMFVVVGSLRLIYSFFINESFFWFRGGERVLTYRRVGAGFESS